MTAAEDHGDLRSRSTFAGGRPVWLDRTEKVRNVVRQELIARQLDRHLPGHPARVLDVGAGQGTQALRLARAGHQVLAVEPDPEMRAVFAAALRGEPAAVRDRVTLADGSLGELASATGGDAFDAVLLLGVLMYLPSSEPVITELAAHVAPGGLLAVAVRTTASALWRPAARQDWQAALAAFEEHDAARAEGRDLRYVNELGTPARADDLDTLTARAAEVGLHLESWYACGRPSTSRSSTPPRRPTPTSSPRSWTSRNASAPPIRTASWPSSPT